MPLGVAGEALPLELGVLEPGPAAAFVEPCAEPLDGRLGMLGVLLEEVEGPGGPLLLRLGREGIAGVLPVDCGSEASVEEDTMAAGAALGSSTPLLALRAMSQTNKPLGSGCLSAR